jgi:hypothetical protein
LRHIALNLLGRDQSTKADTAAKRKKASWDDVHLLKIFRNNFYAFALVNRLTGRPDIRDTGRLIDYFFARIRSK